MPLGRSAVQVKYTVPSTTVLDLKRVQSEVKPKWPVSVSVWCTRIPCPSQREQAQISPKRPVWQVSRSMPDHAKFQVNPTILKEIGQQILLRWYMYLHGWHTVHRTLHNTKA